ncbi:hypothetical protein BATDEDRAFT_34218 [Batrachochytrium dendrobatidis JAM81]|uniref:Anthranilate synthase component 2 n=1 Tax=Batrachochytrium dendrobatidis (strain JAM81 / FGSC 10211) TaxID=684364 RepID=F4NSZ9_BATDJ|nr:4-amino-4-deoxychorismate synthase [Batrachochytrium dendrobatidis JAM81]EGF83471.1 hypothetical protein BATDEDRAFT_34218 [Batrachochytrium dendrobatidis JAM81]KAK5668056.1 para-aminobenzoate synthase, (PABA) [Batrachochytrium dendrobatidis]|eukprot:XP_006675791.1 hypothetical protein BATDEDRAFT_34218 [Batrachochytrium dendrobatidis JAM81]
MPAADLDNYNADMRILIIDNYDSYTFNLFQYCTLNVTNPPVVVRNDQFEWTELCDRILPNFDAVVISPGPGRPDREEDFGVCKELLLYANIPILGVCLGHQGLASVLGGEVITADSPMHGRLSDICHDGSGLFKNLPNPFSAVRYHSLIVSQQKFPSDLHVTAWTHQNDPSKPVINMGMIHKSRPIWTVQFHPESICTEHGQQIINNFISLAATHIKLCNQQSSMVSPALTLEEKTKLTVLPSSLIPIRHNFLEAESMPSSGSDSKTLHGSSNHIALVFPMCDTFVSAEKVYHKLYADKTSAFWLDSAKVEAGLSRFSYMGDSTGPLGFDIKYSLETRLIQKRKNDVVLESATLEHNDTFFRWLAEIMHNTTVDCQDIHYVGNDLADPQQQFQLPFYGGLVGYFGYEMKAESLRPHTAKHDGLNKFKTESAKHVPDAAFIFSDRIIVYDHQEQNMYLIALARKDDLKMRQTQQDWLQQLHHTLTELAVPKQNHVTETRLASNTQSCSIAQNPKLNPKNGWMKLTHERAAYIANIEASNEKINQGETYEVCLTTQLTRNLGKMHTSPFQFYQHLRNRNPAPYGGFLSFGEGLFIASSSPERFLQLSSDKWLSMKPIKGTLPTATRQNFSGTVEEMEQENHKRRIALAISEKDRSENLMIVDLIRNDLNQISEPQTVHVPHLMVVESYATVHQLVSTVKGKLRSDLNAVDAVMRTFPPGSMTGAPKLRTVHILEELEKTPRGPYSGVLGFFSVTGSADFNVIIRTAIFAEIQGETMVTIGAGGAIVALSNPLDEYDEMLLKANSVLPSLVATFDTTPTEDLYGVQETCQI